MIGGKKKRKRIKSMRACSKGNKIRGDKNRTIKKYKQCEFYRKDWIRLNKNKNKNLFRILLLLFVFFSSWIREREEEEEGESEKNREGGRKERERGEERLTNELIMPRERSAEKERLNFTWVKAASRVMTRRPIHVRYLGHTWILIHAAIAASLD